MYGARWVHFGRPWTQESMFVLTDFGLAEKRLAEALHAMFFQLSIRAQHNDLLSLLVLLLRVYCRMIRSHEKRGLDALLFLFSRSESPLPPTVGCLAAERRRDCVRSCIAVVFALQ